MSKNYSKIELRQDVRETARTLERIPKAKEHERMGEIPLPVFREQFGNWPETLFALGIADRQQYREEVGTLAYTVEECVKDLRATANQVGAPPLSDEHSELGTVPQRVFYRHWDSWEEVLKAAGVWDGEAYRKRHYHLSSTEQMPWDDPWFLHVAYNVRGQSIKDIARACGVSNWLIQKNIKKAGFDTTQATAKDEIIEDVRRVAKELGKIPSSLDYKRNGQHSLSAVNGNFDGFCDLLSEAGVYDVIQSEQARA